MESVIDLFHVDIRLLAAQTINFGIVIAVLYFLIFKPLTRVMGDRTEKIEKSLEEAKKIDEKMSAAQAEYKDLIFQGKQEANGILSEAKKRGEARREEMIEKAKKEIGAIVEKGKTMIRQEKAETIKEIKSEIAELVIAGMEKVMEKKIDAKEDKELIRKIMKQ